MDYILGVPRREVEWPGEPEIVGRTEGEEIGIGRVERLLDSVHSNVKGVHLHLVCKSHTNAITKLSPKFREDSYLSLLCL